MFVRFFYNYDVIVIPKEHMFNKVEDGVNVKLEEYKSELTVECHKNYDDIIYCIFPKTELRLFFPTGQSMMPYFHGESEILLCNENFTLEEGGIYAFEHSASEVPVVHRCIHQNSYGCIFKGDNNVGSENITNEQVLCKVDWMIRQIN